MLTSAHQGYVYQDVLGAYFVAQEISQGRDSTQFHFDHKKTKKGVSDKFDDLAIYQEDKATFIQIKYSNDEHQHHLTKQDFSSSSYYDLALFDLFETWKALHQPGYHWRICLAWNKPTTDDPICEVLELIASNESLVPGTICYKLSCNKLWPEDGEVLSSWKALKKWSKSVKRAEFEVFLDHLVIEVGYPKSSLLQDYSIGLEKLLANLIEMIGIGVYPNDHLSVRDIAERLCSVVRSYRSTKNSLPIACNKIAQQVGIIQSYGGIEQKFPIDKTVLVTTPERIDQVIEVLEEHRTVVLTAEPGAGKSWFIENLENHLNESTQIIKHYCYVSLEDPLSADRITVNVLYGSLITQIIQSDEELKGFKSKRYASNLEELNILIGKIKKKTLLIIDGIDHIWRVYQKNRGGITEDETTIIKSLAKLEYYNPNVLLLIISQPIEGLTELTPFYQCTLSPLPEVFVEDLLKKHNLHNVEIKETLLSKIIHEKSQGNALYCKYLIDHSIEYRLANSFDWITSLPPYQFNLTGYYKYLYEQVQGDAGVPYALCGADFSLNEDELKNITHLGNTVTKQLMQLKPILRYNTAYGYTIYHESFKRFLIDKIKETGASINHLIYRPLIEWLETQSFFESTKAYGHLLKLYYEVDLYDKIAKSIDIDFIDNSLYYAQPFLTIYQNHRLQKSSLRYVEDLSSMIVIAEQSKIIYELENLSGQALIKYLKAVKRVKGDESMYRVLWDGENLLINKNEALQFLVQQAYNGESIVHWSIIEFKSGIPYEMLGLIAVKLLHTKKFEDFDQFVKDVKNKTEDNSALEFILFEIEWYIIYYGEDWLSKTPNFQEILTNRKSSSSTITEAVDRIISNDRFDHDDNWKDMIYDLILTAKTATHEEKESVIVTLSNYNWFRNWLIYFIKITDLSQRKYESKELINAFSYLVRDLEPFKGTPRVSDLYKQLPFIKKSFHEGLLLCNNDEDLLYSCCKLLERVTEVSTSIFGSVSGPLKNEEYLELIAKYLPKSYILNEYKKYYAPIGSRRVYSDVAEIAFEYAYVLSVAGEYEEAQIKYREGIQALTAYGYRKDRTLSEILYCSVPYQQTYGTLSVEWFYELYHMAMTVVLHTDGKSTNHYPTEWFEEFIKVYPDDAIKFLVSETLENSQARWHQEQEFYHILKNHPSLFNPTQWFLLCRSLPLALSDEIIDHALDIKEQIELELQEVYNSWLLSLPKVSGVSESLTHSIETATRFQEQFGVTLKTNNKEIKQTQEVDLPIHTTFPTASVQSALAFLENNVFMKHHSQALLHLINSTNNWEDTKLILRQIALSFKYERHIESWIENIFQVGSQEWLYLNVCLFVFIIDGWYHGLHNIFYLKQSYKIDPSGTLSMLKEVLAEFLISDRYSGLMSCNLIKALCELGIDELEVHKLLLITHQIVKRRLPNPGNSEINASIYNGLNDFNKEEITVSLLIARLKTLTTEKTQNIVWALSYIAKKNSKSLFRPYTWAFSNSEFLLPIHRSLLLQIIIEIVDLDNVPNFFIIKLLEIFPTGFFLEDQFIRNFLSYKIELKKDTSMVLLSNNIYDSDFLSFIHPKYRSIEKYCAPLTGVTNTYIHKRDEISKKYNSYYLKSEKILTPITPLANAAYEIANNYFYSKLKILTDELNEDFTCNLNFYLSEMILQVGSLSQRPFWIDVLKDFPIYQILDADSYFENEGWTILGFYETEIYGDTFKSKETIKRRITLSFLENINERDLLYAKYLFRTDYYLDNELSKAKFDQPICILDIKDDLEHSNIVFVSPYIVQELKLSIDSNIHNGFKAINEEGEIIIRMITWKERYYGSIDDGTEVPTFQGTAVIIRSDYYKRLTSLYEQPGKFVLSQKSLHLELE